MNAKDLLAGQATAWRAQERCLSDHTYEARARAILQKANLPTESIALPG